ncbi:hypothetical protein T01_11586 [Trichinella spiralis]|uniref:Secreted protein n=1 Tax=Trichinella spiralis TaxID=6334 RepID=A0A0V1BWF2_TRISP|nr:hypothetical protein T01_11586 [Trichinella spiralis]
MSTCVHLLFLSYCTDSLELYLAIREKPLSHVRHTTACCAWTIVYNAVQKKKTVATRVGAFKMKKVVCSYK